MYSSFYLNVIAGTDDTSYDDTSSCISLASTIPCTRFYSPPGVIACSTQSSPPPDVMDLSTQGVMASSLQSASTLGVMASSSQSVPTPDVMASSSTLSVIASSSQSAPTPDVMASSSQSAPTPYSSGNEYNLGLVTSPAPTYTQRASSTPLLNMNSSNDSLSRGTSPIKEFCLNDLDADLRNVLDQKEKFSATKKRDFFQSVWRILNRMYGYKPGRREFIPFCTKLASNYPETFVLKYPDGRIADNGIESSILILERIRDHKTRKRNADGNLKGENEEGEKDANQQLKLLYSDGEKESKKVKDLITAQFTRILTDIKNKMRTNEIFDKWPHLLQLVYFLDLAQHITGK